MLAGRAAFTTYGQVGWRGMLNKAGLLLSKYFGLGERFQGAWWQLALLFLLAAAGLFFFIRRRNRMALFGFIWLGLGVGVSLPIHYAPARYNYIPLMGFWLMVVFFAAAEARAFLRHRPERRRVAAVVLGLPLLFYLAQQAIMLQWEIGDYRLRGQLHERVAAMYERVQGEIPPDRPLLFIDLGKRQAVQEMAASVKGYNKLLFVRKRAIWEQVFLAPLANFLGQPALGVFRRSGARRIARAPQGKNDHAFLQRRRFLRLERCGPAKEKSASISCAMGNFPIKSKSCSFARRGGQHEDRTRHSLQRLPRS